MRKLMGMICFLLLISGCGAQHKLPLQQPSENIVEIRLVNNSDPDHPTCRSLVGGEVAEFMQDLQMLECHKRWEPVGEFGSYEVHIIYSDESVDILGSKANGYMECGEMVVSGWYYFEKEAFAALFFKYQQ